MLADIRFISHYIAYSNLADAIFSSKLSLRVPSIAICFSYAIRMIIFELRKLIVLANTITKPVMFMIPVYSILFGRSRIQMFYVDASLVAVATSVEYINISRRCMSIYSYPYRPRGRMILTINKERSLFAIFTRKENTFIRVLLRHLYHIFTFVLWKMSIFKSSSLVSIVMEAAKTLSMKFIVASDYAASKFNSVSHIIPINLNDNLRTHNNSNIASNCSIIREKGGIKWTYKA